MSRRSAGRRRPARGSGSYDISRSDGADRTRPGDPARNGEPFGEIGLVMHGDADWGDQHGGPADPQPGHSKSKRDAVSIGNVGVRTPGPAPAGMSAMTLSAGGALDLSGDLLSGALVTMVLQGDADTTRDSHAVLELGFAGAATLTLMRFSTDGGLTWTDWIEYSEFGEVVLPTGDGEKFVLVEVLDEDGTLYLASDAILLDTKGPTISLAGIANGAVLDVTASVRFTFAATDENGVTSTKATLDAKALANGSLIDAGLLLAGSHTILVTAVDDAGNVTTSTVTFTVRASAVGIIAEVEQAIGQGLVQANMRGALLAKLQAAQTAIERGQKSHRDRPAQPVHLDGPGRGGQEGRRRLGRAAGQLGPGSDRPPLGLHRPAAGPNGPCDPAKRKLPSCRG